VCVYTYIYIYIYILYYIYIYKLVRSIVQVRVVPLGLRALATRPCVREDTRYIEAVVSL